MKDIKEQGIKYSRGKNPNSRNSRRYIINENFFEVPDVLNCYFAGFIAADGNISGRRITIGLAEKDEIVLKEFIKSTEASYNIKKYLTRGEFPSIYLTVSSEKMCEDLRNNFNITSRKSLTLIPPSLQNKELIDAFIIGYIDGDGSINLMNSKRNQQLQIQILGTLEMCTFVENRFREILGTSKVRVYKNKEHSGNTYSVIYSDKQARKLFLHYYHIEVPKLKRKWSKEKYQHSSNFKKYENLEKYKTILNFEREEKSQKEIAKIMNISQAAVSWYQNRESYKILKIK